MSGGTSGISRPRPPLPTDQSLRRGPVHAFPPDIAVGSHRHVRENSVVLYCRHSVWIGLAVRAGSHAEVARFRINRPEAAVWPRMQPGDVLADCPNLPSPAFHWRAEHGKIRFAACAREGAGN